jgi:hypothetical protein
MRALFECVFVYVHFQYKMAAFYVFYISTTIIINFLLKSNRMHVYIYI